ncbi:hypothetical protein [Angustibacter luteus]|uniref:Integral membrane protein n=1 Tax=Angustibacter luteus TaxID=658456 RepID=A0ABW1JGN7_9ACTN
MSVVYNIVVVMHLLGMAAVVGGYLTVLRQPRVLGIMRDGAGTALLAGIVLVGLAESDAVDKDLNHAKMGVKLVVALAVLALAIVGAKRDREGKDSAVLAHLVGGLAILNVVVAAVWR